MSSEAIGIYGRVTGWITTGNHCLIEVTDSHGGTWRMELDMPMPLLLEDLRPIGKSIDLEINMMLSDVDSEAPTDPAHPIGNDDTDCGEGAA